MLGVSVTTVGHAETGRLWQARGFWERAYEGLLADGALLRLHEQHQAAAVRPARRQAARRPPVPRPPRPRCPRASPSAPAA